MKKLETVAIDEEKLKKEFEIFYNDYKNNVDELQKQ